jgi:hypothetical protein
MIQYLIQSRCLRSGLNEKQGRDILWALTSRDMYRMLVRDQGWTAQQFEDWLANLLVETLIEPTASRATA